MQGHPGCRVWLLCVPVQATWPGRLVPHACAHCRQPSLHARLVRQPCWQRVERPSAVLLAEMARTWYRDWTGPVRLPRLPAPQARICSSLNTSRMASALPPAGKAAPTAWLAAAQAAWKRLAKLRNWACVTDCQACACSCSTPPAAAALTAASPACSASFKPSRTCTDSQLAAQCRHAAGQPVQASAAVRCASTRQARSESAAVQLPTWSTSACSSAAASSRVCCASVTWPCSPSCMTQLQGLRGAHSLPHMQLPPRATQSTPGTGTCTCAGTSTCTCTARQGRAHPRHTLYRH